MMIVMLMSQHIKPVCVNSPLQNVGGDVLYELLIFLLLISARTKFNSWSDTCKYWHFLKNRCKYLDLYQECADDIWNFQRCCDHSLFEPFEGIMKTSNHVLHAYLPQRRDSSYHLRQRFHNRTLITKTNYLNDHNLCDWCYCSQLTFNHYVRVCVS